MFNTAAIASQTSSWYTPIPKRGERERERKRGTKTGEREGRRDGLRRTRERDRRTKMGEKEKGIETNKRKSEENGARERACLCIIWLASTERGPVNGVQPSRQN